MMGTHMEELFYWGWEGAMNLKMPALFQRGNGTEFTCMPRTHSTFTTTQLLHKVGKKNQTVHQHEPINYDIAKRQGILHNAQKELRRFADQHGKISRPLR